MVHGVTPSKLAALAKTYPLSETHLREHLTAIRDMAEEARFGTPEQAKAALGQIVLGCRCALK